MHIALSLQPWSSRSSTELWFGKVARAAQCWQPHPALAIDARLFRETLLEAIDAGADWLLHPCVNSLTLPPDARQIQRDFLLAVWTAAYVPARLGCIRVPFPLTAWTNDGGLTVPAGTHDLAELGACVNKAEWPFRIALDVWGYSLGFSPASTWSSLGPQHAAQFNQQLDAEIRRFIQAISLLEAMFPECCDWAAAVTKVVVPFQRDEGEIFHSSSTEDLPGAISMDLSDVIQILEALVHESAHRHLYLLVEGGPLIDPEHRGQYHSPLRIEPRPLEGIFKAYHALAYIVAFYADAVRAELVAKTDPDLADLQEKLADAEATLIRNRRYLTPAGCSLFDETQMVAEYGRA